MLEVMVMVFYCIVCSLNNLSVIILQRFACFVYVSEGNLMSGVVCITNTLVVTSKQTKHSDVLCTPANVSLRLEDRNQRQKVKTETTENGLAYAVMHQRGQLQ